MPITIQEVRGITNDSTSTERHFFINGTLSVVDARAALITQLTTAVELTYAGHPYKDCSLVEDIRYAWRARVLYVTDQNTGGGGDPNDALSFDTTGGTRKITIGLDERKSTGAPYARQLIGINQDGSVEGVQAVAKAFNFQRRKTIPADEVTTAYIGALFAATATINNAAWDLYAAEQVVFLGSRGQKSQYGQWEMEFFFSAAPTPGTIYVPGKTTTLSLAGVKSWDAQWTLNEPYSVVVGGINIAIPVPIGVYANAVYESTNFALLNSI